MQLCCEGQTLDEAEKLEELCEIYAGRGLEYGSVNGEGIIVDGGYLSALVCVVIDADELEHIVLIIELGGDVLSVVEFLDKIGLVADLLVIALHIGKQKSGGVNGLMHIFPYVLVADDAVDDL